MSIHHLRVFLAVYMELSITKAAQKLFISQPAVSKYIREIEEFYGNRLFDRSSRTLTVTPFGVDFFHYASQIIALYDEMNQTLAPSRWHEKSLRIGTIPVIGELNMSKLSEEYTSLHPDITISVTVAIANILANHLMDNSLDFAITEEIIDYPLITTHVIYQEKLVAICNKDNPLAKQPVVTAKDLVEYPILFGQVTRPVIEAYFERHQLSATCLWESASVIALINAVNKNLGISFMARGHVLTINDPNVVILNVPDLNEIHNICIHYRKNRKLSPMMQDFIRTYHAYITRFYRNND